MNDKLSEETRSYQDPAAVKIRAAQDHRATLAAEYPAVTDVYDGFYLKIDDLSVEGGRYFLGAGGIVGSSVSFDSSRFCLLSEEGSELALLDTQKDEHAKRLKLHASQGWHITLLLSASFLRAQDRRVSVELACICWAPLPSSQEAALTTFAHHIADRLASSDRAALLLSQDQFIAVLRSEGSWYLTPSTKREPLEKGTVIYKARRSAIERLTAYALKHKTGCNVLAVIFWLLLLGGLMALFWFLLFR